MNPLLLKVDVPMSNFRTSFAGGFRESYPVPPHSTCYGMLLSLIGEWNKWEYKTDSELAIGMVTTPSKSQVLRTQHRYKKDNLLERSNRIPDYIEVLSNVGFVLGVKGRLADKVHTALTNSETIDRHGSLSLGESIYIVNAIDILEFEDIEANWLVQSEDGFLALPCWVDPSMKFTRWNSFSFQRKSGIPNLAWTKINGGWGNE